MRVLIFALFLVAYGEGRPGYEYSNPHTNLVSTDLFSSNQFQPTGFHGGISSVGSVGSIGSIGSTGFTGASTSLGGISTVSTHHHQQPIITKHFYIHSAPDDAEEAVHKQIVVGSPRKNYRVVFIKAPSSRGSARISVVPSPSEDKTVIYVLSKKPDAADIHADVQPVTNLHNKPEVFFIKYKTQEEALQAQRKIQAQYDALGGSSHVSDEGVAPVTSVIGQLGGHLHTGGSRLHTSINLGPVVGTGVSSGYLPPTTK